MVIREALKEDALEYVEYLNKIAIETDFLTFGVGEIITTKAEQVSMIEGANAVNQLMLVAILDNKMVGGLNYRGGARPRVQHAGELGITVLKEYWGLGIGTELLRYLIDWSKRSKLIRKVNLRVRSDNHRAIMLYTRHGFAPEGMITRDLLIGEKFYDSICMGMQID